ncbi:SGNH/GDSL hydrolase family protein [Taibaiella soli]|uniref:SGNH hydrolase-type esterase domain-containing protein n=1 Tax=Taibaiella soli TaxID=1649169 RepID=A0A2W2AEK2_9BACT|nr:GDSL-type esterase/lipase family protein [Taibaiella soli]PZF73895.1 hypothetical protein DN068_06015 [Taibaiella soli]
MKRTFSALLLLACCLGLLLYGCRKSAPVPGPGSFEYRYNVFYKDGIKYFHEFAHPSNIVMLGTSLTYYGDWCTMLRRADVMAQGIQGDNSFGFKHRMNLVFDVHPRICFVEVGANDARNVSATTFYLVRNNINGIINTLKAKDVVPVLTTIPYGISNSDKRRMYNTKVYIMNELIRDIAAQQRIKLIDLNKMCAEGLSLKPEYASWDGGHLSAKGFRLWVDAVQDLLWEYKI